MNLYCYLEYLYRGASDLQLVIVFLSDLLAAAGLWGVFKKAKKDPFLALIPGISTYCSFSIAWDRKFGIADLILKALFIILYPKNAHLLVSGFRGTACFLLMGAFLLLELIMKWKLAFSFRKDIIFAFYLTFLPQVFFLILGSDRSVYHGPTLRSYNGVIPEKAEQTEAFEKKPMINLYKRRSIIALVSAAVVFVFTSYAVGIGLLETPIYLEKDTHYSLFKYFTTNSNTLSAIGAAFLIPYAAEGIRVNRFSFPKWVGMIQYSGAICTTLTMIFCFFFILPTEGKEFALGGMNFYLHLVCPLMAIVLFLSVESDFRFTIYDSVVCLMPFCLYALLYLVFVVMIGTEYGGWQDLYHLTERLPVSTSACGMFAFALAVALGIRHLYNILSDRRKKEMMSSLIGRETGREIEDEARDLGRHYGFHDDRNDMTIPVDILESLAKEHDKDIGVLYHSFVEGMNEGLQEKEKRRSEQPAILTLLFGTPRDLSEKENKD